MEYSEIVQRLESLADPARASGMARFGIKARPTYGIRVPLLRKLARESGKTQRLAQQLWASEVHEARIFASMIADPKQVTEELMDSCAADFTPRTSATAAAATCSTRRSSRTKRRMSGAFGRRSS